MCTLVQKIQKHASKSITIKTVRHSWDGRVLCASLPLMHMWGPVRCKERFSAVYSHDKNRAPHWSVEPLQESLRLVKTNESPGGC